MNELVAVYHKRSTLTHWDLHPKAVGTTLTWQRECRVDVLEHATGTGCSSLSVFSRETTRVRPHIRRATEDKKSRIAVTRLD